MSNSQRCFASLNMTSGASLMDICIGQSKLSVQMKYLGFLWRVLRQLVWETATDTTTGLAAQMAYLLLFALAPGSLFLWHLLGLFGTDPTKLHRMFLLLKSFMPPDPKVQDILDSAMANVVVTGSSGLLANAGIILGIYFGTVFIATTSRALSHTYGMREDPHWWSKYITSFFMLFWFGIIIVFCFNAIVFGERLAGLAEVNFQLAFPLQAWIATLNLPFTFVALVILALASGAIDGTLLNAQVSEEEKSRRNESEQIAPHVSPSPKPKKSPSPIAKASRNKSEKKRLASATPEKAPTAIPHAKLAKEESTSDDKASQDAQDSPRPRKAKPAKKSDDEEEATPKPTPRETPEPGATPKSKRRHTPTPKPKSKKSQEKEVSRKTKKAGKSKSARKEEETRKPEKTPPPRAGERAPASERPTPAPKALGAAAPTPAPSAESKVPRATPSGERAQVVIEKSGLEEDQGLEPAPTPPPRRGFWPWSRSSSNYRYLTRSVIEAIRRAPVKRRRWQFIVVHNSGTRQGNARVFDYYHRHVRRMQNGLAYHFVIGNGTSTGNGQVEVGDRWRRQINGGHVHSDYLNNISLGICLVGDFNRGQPTRAQLDACEELIR